MEAEVDVIAGMAASGSGYGIVGDLERQLLLRDAGGWRCAIRLPSLDSKRHTVGQ